MRAFTKIAFSDAVKAMQEKLGARKNNQFVENRAPANEALTEDIVDFIGERDSFYLGTASVDGWPYIQHRGGPRGFLKVLDERSLAFADFAGNRQYISVGNLAESDKVILFLMDYAARRRLKIWGRAESIEAEAIDNDPALIAKLAHADYRAIIERIIRVDVLAWDFNCHQHISPR